MPADRITAALREAATAWSLSPADLAICAQLDEGVVVAALGGDADASELGALATALGGTLDDLLAGRAFWEAPSAAFKNAPSAVELPLVRATLLRVASAARERNALVQVLGLEDGTADNALSPVSLIGSIPAQAEELATRVRDVLDARPG